LRPPPAESWWTLAGRADLTLVEGIAVLATLIGLAGGLLYLVIYLLVLRDGGQG
jgi:hypothetical protein